MHFKLIPKRSNEELRCHFCGETRSVKYCIEAGHPKTAEFYACNRCALQWQAEQMGKGEFKMPDRIKNILVNELEIDADEVEYMSNHEIFDAILNYEGFCGYGTWIRNLVSEVYGVQFDD